MSYSDRGTSSGGWCVGVVSQANIWKKWIPDPDKKSETPTKGKVVEQSFIYYNVESEGQGGRKV